MTPASKGKSQPAISRFFQASSPAKAPESPEVPQAKRKLAEFASATKKARPDAVPDQVHDFASDPEPAESPPPDEPAVPKKPRAAKPRAAPQAKKKAAPKLTPLEQQFKDLKSAHPDKLLAIQVGYKFKFIGEDAVVASQLLNIMLIRGNIGLEERTHDRYAYCSIPDNRLHIHLQRLLNHNLKVGVVKQTETAAIKSVESTNKSGLFQRQITAVYTKATYMGEESLADTYNQTALPDVLPGQEGYIVCIDEVSFPRETAVMAVQPVTGDIVYDVFADKLSREELETRCAYLNPADALVITNSGEIPTEVKTMLRLQSPNISVSVALKKSDEAVQADLTDFFSTVDANGSSVHLAEHYILSYPACVQRCVAALISYLSEFKLSNVFTIPSNISTFTDSKSHMLLPASTLRALDVFDTPEESTKGTLFWLLNHTRTHKGARLLRKWVSRPLVVKARVQERLDAVEQLVSEEFSHILDAFKTALTKVGKSGIDLERSLIKIHYSATYETDKIARKELFLLLRSFNDILQVFRNFGAKGIEEFKAKHGKSKLLVDTLEALFSASESSVVEGVLAQINSSAALSEKGEADQAVNYFNASSSEKFQDILSEKDAIAATELLLQDELEDIRKFLKRPKLQYVSVLKDTHMIEVRNGAAANSVPADWLKISATKSVSRFRTPAVSSLHKKLQYHSDMLMRRCNECFNKFLREIDSHYTYLCGIVHHMAVFDCLLSLSTLAREDSAYSKPTLVDEQTIEVDSGSHPVLSKLFQGQASYVPNDINISYDRNRVLIITGPNMGGKSSYVKQIALFVMMTQIGCFLPCNNAKMGIFDSIYVRMGASDNILKGKSTFMVEMSECASIIKSYTAKSLIILDEIGRGTGTSDGIALAYSILKYITEDAASPTTLFITHYPSLHVLSRQYDVVNNFHMAFVEKVKNEGEEHEWPEVVFLYKVVQGVVSNSYGLNVAKLAGVDTAVIDSAYEVSETMKKSIEKQTVLSHLSAMTSSNALETIRDLAMDI